MIAAFIYRPDINVPNYHNGDGHFSVMNPFKSQHNYFSKIAWIAMIGNQWLDFNVDTIGINILD